MYSTQTWIVQRKWFDYYDNNKESDFSNNIKNNFKE